LQDEIRDLRHPTTRPDESIIHSDEKHEPLPDAGSPKEEWEAYRRREGMNSRVNRLSRKSKLFNFRWTKVMAKYRVFQENLLEAQVHGISDDRSSHELDEFLNRVYYLFKLWLLDQQDKPEGLSLRHELERKNLLPLEGWTAEKSDIMALDKLDADLKVLIEKLDHTAYLHMLDRSTRSRLAKRKWHM
jgi:hypothetical protein